MSKTNCVNCGAAKDIDAIKCPFCGTTYLDLTAIDFSSNAQVVCDFVLPGSRDVLQMVAIPRLESATVKQELSDFDFGVGHRYFASEWSAEFRGNIHTDTPQRGAVCDKKKGRRQVLDKIREAFAMYCAEFGKMPGVVYMSDTAYKETVAFFRKKGFAIWFDDMPAPDCPVTFYGAKVEIVPYPDNLVIVGGIKVNV